MIPSPCMKICIFDQESGYCLGCSRTEEEIIKWKKKPLKIVLENESNLGEDNLKLFFKITKSADLLVKCFDMKDEFLGEYNLGNIF